MKKIVFLLFVMLWTLPTKAEGARPMDALQGPIDQVIDILNQEQADPVGRDLEREKLWGVMRTLFDFTEMAKRTLARNWTGFNPEQRKTFSRVFGEFLGNTYLDKIQKGYKNEKVVYVKEEMVGDAKALVKTKILRETLEIPVNYSMRMHDGMWRVYDVNIEGVSLVKNYRTQFGKILLTKSPDQLIEQLRAKTEAWKVGQAAPKQASR